MLKALTALTVASLFVFSDPAMAMTDTERLVKTLESVNVPVFMDGAPCKTSGVQGVYSAKHNQMLLCVDGAHPSALSAEQRDTLRHESVHAMQDCAAGQENLDMATLLSDEDLIRALVASGIDPDRVIAVYGSNGASDRVIRLELEAFALAALVTDGQAVAALEATCKF